METTSWVVLAASGWVVAVLVMLVLWMLYLVRKDPSVVDVGWGGSIGLAAALMFLRADQYGFRQVMLVGIVLAWSVRLVSLLLQRYLRGHKDRRYEELSRHWQEGLTWKYLLFFQAQALSVGVLVIPIALAYLATAPFFTIWDLLGLPLALLGLLGESLADRQLAAFRRNPENKAKVCNVGLWRYSRHPNYFFEWLVWMGYATVAMNHPAGLFGWISPAVILYSIVKVTGIPPTEERLLASKGDAYREYQRKTSVFFPLPPKE